MLLVKEKDGNLDELFDKAVKECVPYDVASASFLQRRLSIGYARAARLLDQLEYAGIVSPANGAEPRRILITKKKSTPGDINKPGTKAFLWANSELIRNVLDAHGIKVKLVRVDVQQKNILFLFDFAVGTKIDDILKLNKEIAAILASPTGKVEMGAPFKGTSLLFIYLPVKRRMKKESYRVFDINVEEIKPKRSYVYKRNVRDFLLRISYLLENLAYKI